MRTRVPIPKRRAVSVIFAFLLLAFPKIASATVYEFGSDGSVITHEALDYLSRAHKSHITHQSTYMQNRSTSKEVYEKFIASAAERFNVDQALIHAVIQVESAYHHDAVSPKGAEGLMQLMPQTARRYHVVDALDPEQNINGGTKYLRDLIDRYEGNLKLAVAAYNAGEGAVDKYNGIPPYTETLDYIEKIQIALGRTLS